MVQQQDLRVVRKRSRQRGVRRCDLAELRPNARCCSGVSCWSRKNTTFHFTSVARISAPLGRLDQRIWVSPLTADD
jgi:hypothetical protein